MLAIKTPRDAKGRFLPRSTPATVPAVADVPLLVVGLERVDPVPALRREVLPAALVTSGAPALVREVGRSPARRPEASWVQRHPWVTSWVSGTALVGSVVLAGALIHGWI